MTSNAGDPSAAAVQEASVAVRALLRSGHELQTALAERLDMGVTDVQAIDELVASPTPLGPVELGHRLGIRSASATVLVARLERAGHLARDRHPEDGRRISLVVTDSARAEVREALRPLIDSFARMTADLGPDQRTAVITFLRELTGMVRAFTAEHPGE